MEMVKGDFHSDFLGGLNQKFSGHNGFKTDDILVPQGPVAGFKPCGLMLVPVCLCVYPKGISKKEKGNLNIAMPKSRWVHESPLRLKTRLSSSSHKIELGLFLFSKTYRGLAMREKFGSDFGITNMLKKTSQLVLSFGFLHKVYLGIALILVSDAIDITPDFGQVAIFL